MTNPVVTIDERIERAAAEMARREGYAPWLALAAGLQESYRINTTAVLNAACPELMDGSAWVAPTEPTDEMAYLGEGYSDFCDTPGVIEGHEARINEVKMIYGVMRAVYVEGFATPRGERAKREVRRIMAAGIK